MSDLRSTISCWSPYQGEWESTTPGCYSEPILNDVTIIQYEFIFMGLDRNDEQLQQPADLLSVFGRVLSAPEGLEGGEERLKR